MNDEYDTDDCVSDYPKLVTSFQKRAPRRYQFGLLSLLIATALLPPCAAFVAWIVDGHVLVAGLVTLLSLAPTLTIVASATAYSSFRPGHALGALAVSCAVLLFLAGFFLSDTYRGTHLMQAFTGQKPSNNT